MTGKLIKISGIYTLMCDDKMIASDDLDFQSDYQIGKLSLKNCQAIELGYDLDELIKEQYPIDEPSFKRGFKLALEILGDKKFSEEDVRKSISYMFEQTVVFGNRVSSSDVDRCIQSLQQTEWDVSFNPDEKDSDGCLILKRV